MKFKEFYEKRLQMEPGTRVDFKPATLKDQEKEDDLLTPTQRRKTPEEIGDEV